MDEDVEAIAQAIARAEVAVAFTGAGISTESGVPDFRGDEGLWTKHDPSDLHITRFREDPGRFWKTWLKLHDSVTEGEVEPNAGHEALAEWTRDGVLEAVVTQNGDGLHQDAGTPDERVVELHGTFREGVCQACQATESMDALVDRVRDGEVPPLCTGCGGTLKPGAVLFGEALPTEELRRAQHLAGRSDVFLVVGSSLSVHPAAGLPAQAKRDGAFLAIVNLDETPLDEAADVVVHGEAGETLTRIDDRL